RAPALLAQGLLRLARRLASVGVVARRERARFLARSPGLTFPERALIAGSGVGMLLLFLVIKDSLTDDAYITLAYAKNLALHLHWGLIPQEVGNSATSPLNVVVLAILTSGTRLGVVVHRTLAS